MDIKNEKKTKPYCKPLITIYQYETISPHCGTVLTSLTSTGYTNSEEMLTLSDGTSIISGLLYGDDEEDLGLATGTSSLTGSGYRLDDEEDLVLR